MLKDVLPLSEQSFTKSNVLIQGVKSEAISVPLYMLLIYILRVSGPVMVGAMTSLQIEGISLILAIGNDLARDRVMADPCVCSKSCLGMEAADSELQRSGVFPSCAVTRAMTKKKADSEQDAMPELIDQKPTKGILLDEQMSNSLEGIFNSPRLMKDQLIKINRQTQN